MSSFLSDIAAELTNGYKSLTTQERKNLYHESKDVGDAHKQAAAGMTFRHIEPQQHLS